MAYLISDMGRQLLEDARRFCSREVKEPCRRADREERHPQEVWQKAAELGYHTLTVPEELGGLGLEVLDAAAILEEIAKADAGLAVSLAAGNLALETVLLAGNAAQKQMAADWIVGGGLGAFCLTEAQAGSDIQAISTQARRQADGSYVLSGRKAFITNGLSAKFYCLAARTEEGLSFFLIPAGTEGLTAEQPERKLGLRTCETCGLELAGCRVPAEALLGRAGRGGEIAMKALNSGRVWIAVLAVGTAQQALDEAIAYGRQRMQFGRSILENQAVRFRLAEMDMKIESARQMTAHALVKMAGRMDFAREAAIAKAVSAEAAVEVTGGVMDLFGGVGYCGEYPAEKLLRDARAFQVLEGTGDMQRMCVSRILLGRES